MFERYAEQARRAIFFARAVTLLNARFGHRFEPSTLWIDVGGRFPGGKAIGTAGGFSAVQREWREEYGAFSVSASKRGTVEQYIATQEKHRRGMTFERSFWAS
jgi:hypothetical protein